MTDTAARVNAPDLADVLATTWQTCMGGPPPADWLAQATTAHLTRLSDQARSDAAQAAGRATEAAQAELTRPRRRIREQLAGAVAEERLDVDLADGMLETFGMPALRRCYTVHLDIPFTVRVSAEYDEAAYDAACTAIDDALTADGDDITFIWDAVKRRGADQGVVDTDQP